MKAAAYIRVSTDKEEQQSSLENQREFFESYILSPPYEARMKPHLHWEVYQSGKALDPEKF